jgi:hypothetical protein
MLVGCAIATAACVCTCEYAYLGESRGHKAEACVAAGRRCMRPSAHRGSCRRRRERRHRHVGMRVGVSLVGIAHARRAMCTRSEPPHCNGEEPENCERGGEHGQHERQHGCWRWRRWRLCRRRCGWLLRRAVRRWRRGGHDWRGDARPERRGSKRFDGHVQERAHPRGVEAINLVIPAMRL